MSIMIVFRLEVGAPVVHHQVKQPAPPPHRERCTERPEVSWSRWPRNSLSQLLLTAPGIGFLLLATSLTLLVSPRDGPKGPTKRAEF